jgi:hypothetical protein
MFVDKRFVDSVCEIQTNVDLLFSIQRNVFHIRHGTIVDVGGFEQFEFDNVAYGRWRFGILQIGPERVALLAELELFHNVEVLVGAVEVKQVFRVVQKAAEHAE